MALDGLDIVTQVYTSTMIFEEVDIGTDTVIVVVTTLSQGITIGDGFFVNTCA